MDHILRVLVTHRHSNECHKETSLNSSPAAGGTARDTAYQEAAGWSRGSKQGERAGVFPVVSMGGEEMGQDELSENCFQAPEHRGFLRFLVSGPGVTRAGG